MSMLLTNWKTSVAGLVIIAVGALHQLFGVDVPGFNLDLGSAITAGLGLIFARDATTVAK